MAALVEELLAQLILRCCSSSADDGLMPASKRRVAMAEEIMRARSDEHLSMARVAREVGVGLRSLELAFVAARAMGPRDALVRIRLERARERLQAAGPEQSVTSIALDCGFAHLGRFPAAYRRAFGESPSETLARARRKNA
jgi:transcriptional regulator GlxA family with amidase domain